AGRPQPFSRHWRPRDMRLRPVGLVLLALAACTPTGASAAAPPDTLVGLWKARRWFGPEARGPLIIQRGATGWTADFMGRALPIRSEGSELTFALPNRKGAWRGRLEPGGTLLGHWYPPPSSAQATGAVYVSPVELEPDGANRWSGQVVPFDDWFTFFLKLQK